MLALCMAFGFLIVNKGGDFGVSLQKTFSENLKKLKGTTPFADFAEEVGVSKSNLHKITSGGANTTLATVDQIAQSLSITSEELLLDAAADRTDRIAQRMLSCWEFYSRLSMEDRDTVKEHFLEIIKIIDATQQSGEEE